MIKASKRSTRTRPNGIRGPRCCVRSGITAARIWRRGDAQSIAAIGNPLIWWGGLAAMLLSWWLGARNRDKAVLTIAVMYLSFYVPWMVSPRSITFLYHYFPMVPLLILSIVWMLRWVEQRWYYGRTFTVLVVAGAAVLFIWFYPVLTGMTISREWMNFGIRWLPSWGF
ncbi:hypothetical protein [Cohnella ginsengisoli]|uniref:hypothetical protein n=1 Tax=Cohnella ginsengisoli TaxID=425004 RepID=UPI0030B90FC5